MDTQYEYILSNVVVKPMGFVQFAKTKYKPIRDVNGGYECSIHRVHQTKNRRLVGHAHVK